MKVRVELNVERSDGVRMSDAQREEALDALTDALAELCPCVSVGEDEVELTVGVIQLEQEIRAKKPA